MKVVTNDLYCGAYLLSKGGLLTEVRLNHSCGRQSCLFVFTGPQVIDLHQEFLSGLAVVNLKDFKAAMIHIKDQMFSCKRQEEKEEAHERSSIRRRV
jgi:hypothetical protein